MKRSAMTLVRGLSLSILVIIAVGCVTQSDHPYTPTPSEAIPVPPGARILAYGPYPIAAFAVPHEPGTVYVWDETDSKMALMTSMKSDAPNEVTDLNQLSKNAFESTHKYRVYFVPAGAMTMTTQPAVSK